jgi:hypothetical protein
MEDVIPYLEQIAQPGCRVILLVYYSVEGLDCSKVSRCRP